MKNLTLLQQQILKAEILEYLRASERLQTAIEQDDQKAVSFLHNKTVAMFNEVCRHFSLPKDWLYEQITYNKENHILKSGGEVTFKDDCDG